MSIGLSLALISAWQVAGQPSIDSWKLTEILLVADQEISADLKGTFRFFEMDAIRKVAQAEKWQTLTSESCKFYMTKDCLDLDMIRERALGLRALSGALKGKCSFSWADIPPSSRRMLEEMMGPLVGPTYPQSYLMSGGMRMSIRPSAKLRVGGENKVVEFSMSAYFSDEEERKLLNPPYTPPTTGEVPQPGPARSRQFRVSPQLTFIFREEAQLKSDDRLKVIREVTTNLIDLRKKEVDALKSAQQEVLESLRGQFAGKFYPESDEDKLSWSSFDAKHRRMAEDAVAMKYDRYGFSSEAQAREFMKGSRILDRQESAVLTISVGDPKSGWGVIKIPIGEPL